jgi:hypothetical protein
VKKKIDSNTGEVVRLAMQVSRTLGLIPEARLKPVFGKMLDDLDADDFAALAAAMKRLSELLALEGQSRQPPQQ